MSWREQYQRVHAALSEGLCPVHGTQLAQVPADTAISGYCAACDYVWSTERES
jgi:hypothetical protein